MKNENLMEENIKITLIYLGRKLTIEVKKFKTLQYIKQKVYEYFFPVSEKISFFHNNRNLDILAKEPLGYIFSGKKIVKLNVIPENSDNLTPIKIIKRFKDSSYSANNVNNSYNIIVSKSRKNINKNNKSNILINSDKNLGKVNKNSKINNCASMDNIINSNKQNKISGKVKLPPIKIKKKENNKNNINVIFNKNNCYECQNNKINIYCRKCDIFLCDKCILLENSKHKNHEQFLLKIEKKTNKGKIKKYVNTINYQFNNSINDFHSDDCNNLLNNFILKSEKNFNRVSGLEEKITEFTNGMRESVNAIDYEKLDEDRTNTILNICNEKRMRYMETNVNEYISPFQPFFILNNIERELSYFFNGMNEEGEQVTVIKNKVNYIFKNVDQQLENTIKQIDSIIKSKK